MCQDLALTVSTLVSNKNSPKTRMDNTKKCAPLKFYKTATLIARECGIIYSKAHGCVRNQIVSL